MGTKYSDGSGPHGSSMWRGGQGSRGNKLAVLFSPTALISPSSLSSIQHFSSILAARGIQAAFVGEQAFEELASYDALFIRMTTSAGGVAHKFALRATKLGLPVLDDPVSITRGCNKVLQHHILLEHCIPTPHTTIVHEVRHVSDAVDRLGLPLVLKITDGCFCRGVEKADTLTQAEEIAERLLLFGSPILVQEFMPTPFDWRIGVLDGRPLFACRYHMVAGHWQIVARGSRGSLVNGPVEPVALDRTPVGVLRLAVSAAGCIGQGFYGVDIKNSSQGPVVIEVNDNPDMDIDAETVANPESWENLADWFHTAVMASRDNHALIRLAR